VIETFLAFSYYIMEEHLVKLTLVLFVQILAIYAMVVFSIHLTPYNHYYYFLLDATAIIWL